jgi:undecaprenyl-diphosphatase
MSTLEAIILGLAQGLSEFLPISSSAHLVIVPYFFGWETPSVSFDLMLHLGTLCAVVAYFWRDLMTIILSFFGKGETARGGRRLGLLIIAGTIPAALAGFLFEEQFSDLFESPRWVALFLIITGVILVASEAAARQRRIVRDLRLRDALLIGVAQAVAIAPGISRSGSTISTGLFLGFTREAAARFSFLLSIPIIVGAAAANLRHGFDGNGGETGAAIAIGFLFSAVSGFLAIKLLLGYVRRHNLRVFALYCWIAGAVTLTVTVFK